MLHALLGLRTDKDLLGHPKSGASWEGFALEQVLASFAPDEAYFWATHQGAELDLLAFRRGRRVGFELKRSDAPTLTPSMRIAMTDLKLGRLYVVHPGTRSYPLAPRIDAVSLATVASTGSA